MKIVFMCGGAREKALKYILERNEEVIGVITPLLSNNNRRFEKVILTALEFGIPVYPVKKNNLNDLLKRLDFEILVSCGFPYIIAEENIQLAKYAINVHPTLLPKYRGFRSGPYIIINGEKESGTTIHFISKEMDKGDILAQKTFPITPFDTTKSVYRKNIEIEGPLLFRVLQDLKNQKYSSYSQNEEEATTYNYIRTPKDSEIDPTKPLIELYNEIRACDPDNYPAFFYIEGQKVCIKIWRPEKPDIEQDMI